MPWCWISCWRDCRTYGSSTQTKLLSREMIFSKSFMSASRSQKFKPRPRVWSFRRLPNFWRCMHTRSMWVIKYRMKWIWTSTWRRSYYHLYIWPKMQTTIWDWRAVSYLHRCSRWAWFQPWRQQRALWWCRQMLIQPLLGYPLASWAR